MRFALTLLALAVLAVGCRRKSTFTPAPYTPDAQSSVVLDAGQWAAKDPANRYWDIPSATGSMRPFITEKHIVLMRRYSGQPFPNGAVVIFNRGDSPRVLHVVSDQNADSVYMSGANNHDSDGWFPKTSIEGFVVGQLNLP